MYEIEISIFFGAFRVILPIDKHVLTGGKISWQKIRRTRMKS